MVILEKPYVSNFLAETMANLNTKVLKNKIAESFSDTHKINLLNDNEFKELINANEFPLIYSNSEDSIEWLAKNIPEHKLLKKINKIKDKANLRETFKEINNVWYKLIKIGELDDLDVTKLPKPFIIKPVKGIASIFIHTIYDNKDWEKAKQAIKKEYHDVKDSFPKEVLTINDLLIEEYIEGQEIACDAYFNSKGEAVVLNVLEHHFASEFDTSDRLYITSKEIVKKYIDKINLFLNKVGETIDLKNFPIHIEMRLNKNNQLVPIEINPMRFMGFCCTDIAHYAYKINPYEYFIKQKKPDWETIFNNSSDKIYSVTVIDIPKHHDKEKIEFDYKKFYNSFSNPLELRKLDYKKYPMAALLFMEIDKSDTSELDNILHSDLSEFIKNNS